MWISDIVASICDVQSHPTSFASQCQMIIPIMDTVDTVADASEQKGSNLPMSTALLHMAIPLLVPLRTCIL